MQVSVIGLGYIGLPTSIALALNGNVVKGFDISEEVVNCLNRGNIHIIEDGLQKYYEKVHGKGTFRAYNTLQRSDIYIISVPTPFINSGDKKKADLTYVMNAAKAVAKLLKKGDLVILESTVPPGTTKKMTDYLVQGSGLGRESFHTAHCPERVLPGNIMYEMKNNDRIIGAEREESALKAKVLYESFLQDGITYITDDVTAEMCKLVENSYRDVNIAFANELSIMSDKLGIDVNRLIELANKHPRVNILSPGIGVGGHCLAVDPYFIVEAFDKEAKIINTARIVNTQKTDWVADKIKNMVKYDQSAAITIMGMSYKPDIDDFRESPSVILANNLANEGYCVKGCDPNSDKAAIEKIEMISMDEALETSDIIVVAQKHKEFLERWNEIIEHRYICF